MLLIGLTCVAAGVVADALFLPHQSIWNDEVTQMKGLALGPAEATRWLADRVQYDLGVADDRMPPLSYWAGWAWSRAFGLREVPMRWFGVACVAGATAAVFAAAGRAWGLGAGAAAALLLATSPNVVMYSVEIRAYALLILASSGTFACLVAYAEAPGGSRGRWLAGSAACGVAAAYTHFFGLVPLGGALLAAAVLAARRGERVAPVVGAGLVAGVAALGLVPFVRASVGLSPVRVAPSVQQKLTGLAKLAYRQFSHASLTVSHVAVGLAALAFLLGLGCALSRKRRSGAASLGVGLALASGAAVVTLAHLAQASFDASQPTYNVWLAPGLALFIASGLASAARWGRVAATAAVALAVAANSYGVAQLAVNGDAFAHTAYRPIGDLIRRIGPGEVAVIHDDGGSFVESWPTHVPIDFNFGGAVREYGYASGGPGAGPVVLKDYPHRRGEVGLSDLPFDALIVVRTRTLYAAEIAAQLRGGVVPAEDGPVTAALLASPGWERVEESTHPAFCGVSLDVFRRARRP
jgi:hypothetical protein